MSDDLGDRGISEGASLAVLVLLTVFVTASVGISVLVLDGDSGDGTQANFSFDYREGGSLVLVTHQEGNALPSGQVRITGPGANTTWAAVAGWNESREVSTGDIVQLSANSDYGNRVGSDDNIRISYVYQNGTTKVLDEWNSGSGSAPGGLG